MTKWFDNPRILPWLVLAFGLFLTVVVWSGARHETVRQLREEFNHEAIEISSRIEKRYQDSRMILRGVSGLFNASEDVTREEFRQYVRSLEVKKYYPGIRSIGLSLLLQHGRKAEFIQRAKRSGVQNYNVWPEGVRKAYAPVFYLESIEEGESQAMGFDLHSEPTRRAALEAARDSGKISLTGRLQLVTRQNGTEHNGMLMYAPVYRGGPHESLEKRRSHIVGWAYLSFSMNEMMAGVIGSEEQRIRENIGIRIYETDEQNTEAELYHSHEVDTGKSGEKLKPLFRTMIPLQLANKKWHLRMHSRPAFEKRQNDTRQYVILGVGISGSLLSTLLVWQLVHGRRRALEIARKMNHDLLDREKRYRQMFEDNASIVYIIDPASGAILDANMVAARFWGYTQEELHGMNIADINLSPLAELHASMQEQAENSIVGPYHFQHRLKSGEVRDVEISRSVLVHQGRRSIYCMAHDITSRRKAESALAESQAKLHAIIETAMDAVVQIDVNGNILDWNTRAEQVFGIKREEAVGAPFLETVFPSEQHQAYHDNLNKFVEAEESQIRHSQFEIVAMHREGRQFPLEVAITSMPGISGGVEYCAFMHDITKRKQNENAIRKARAELENRVFERTAELVRTNKRLNAEIVERTQTQEALQASQEMLRQLVAHQDRIRENERRRIAREIHDELGQHLLVLRIDVSMLGRSDMALPKFQERVEAILQHIDTTMKSVRAIINNLRPSVLDLGLHAALEWQAEEFQRRSGIVCTLEANDEDLDLEDHVATVLFRILQEALTNVLRHAKASRVAIKVHREQGRLVMTIVDNGVGIQQKQHSEQKSFGLVGIRERLHVLGGELIIDSDSGGTRLMVIVPLAG